MTETVRIRCGLDGHKASWVEYDVGEWVTAWHYREIADGSRGEAMTKWVEPYSTDWHVIGLDGEPVSHPGPMPDFEALPVDEQGVARAEWRESWLEAWKQVPLAIGDWLTITPYLAMSEVVAASRKRIS